MIRRSEVLALVSSRDEAGNPLARVYVASYDDDIRIEMVVPAQPSDDGWYRIEGEADGWLLVPREAASSAREMASYLDHESEVTSIDEIKIAADVDDSRRPRVYSSASTIVDQHGVSHVVDIVTDGADYHLDWATMSEAQRDEADAWTATEHEERCAHLP